MQLTKINLRILRYLYRRKSGSTYIELKRKFGESRILELIHSKYIDHNYVYPKDSNGFPIGDISDETLCFISDQGELEVEQRQWFDEKFVLTQILLPIVIAIITTLLTLFLSSLL